MLFKRQLLQRSAVALAGAAIPFGANAADAIASGPFQPSWDSLKSQPGT